MATVFDPFLMGPSQLANRIVMAPISRGRGYGPEACPNPSAARLPPARLCRADRHRGHSARTPGARGYPATPGLHSELQVKAWSEVTHGVHEAGGVIFAQLMHAGRIGHPSLLPDGARPVGPSPLAARASIFTPSGPVQCVGPRELSAQDIATVIGDFAAAAHRAVGAGFDGVELHGGNGFVIHQFLSSNANLRTDGYGGLAANRVSFAVRTVEALADAVGAHRVGLQVSPGNPYNDIDETDRDQLYLALADALAGTGLAYLAVTETNAEHRELTLRLRERWTGAFMLNPYTGKRPTGLADLTLVADGTTDLLSFGSLFLANPDLPRRLAQGGPFNEPNGATYYGGGDQGYTDYPFLEGSAAEPAASVRSDSLTGNQC